jgi:hypothetical protein
MLASSLRAELNPVDAGGFHSSCDEGVAGGQEVPAVGLGELAEFRMPNASLCVVDLEMQSCQVLVSDYFQTLASHR